MKKVTIQYRNSRLNAALAAVALAMLVLPLCQARVAPRHQASVSLHRAMQLADGSESNGGKGGKGSAKLA